MTNHQEGFTLIELLIVIAIIGILASVLIPSLIAARTRAYDASAQGCARAIIGAQAIYRMDNDSYADALAKLDGINACTATGIEATPVTADATHFEWQVRHTSGKATLIVKDNGITRS